MRLLERSNKSRIGLSDVIWLESDEPRKSRVYMLGWTFLLIPLWMYLVS